MKQKTWDAKYLANQFLIAMTAMADDNFARAVVYLYDHFASGPTGLVDNRLTDISLITVIDKVDLRLQALPKAQETVYFGGPVQADWRFVPPEQVLGEVKPHCSSSLRIFGGLTMATSRDVLTQIATGHGPTHFLFFKPVRPDMSVNLGEARYSFAK
jgi:putative transcriptional regulator